MGNKIKVAERSTCDVCCGVITALCALQGHRVGVRLVPFVPLVDILGDLHPLTLYFRDKIFENSIKRDHFEVWPTVVNSHQL